MMKERKNSFVTRNLCQQERELKSIREQMMISKQVTMQEANKKAKRGHSATQLEKFKLETWFHRPHLIIEQSQKFKQRDFEFMRQLKQEKLKMKKANSDDVQEGASLQKAKQALVHQVMSRPLREIFLERDYRKHQIEMQPRKSSPLSSQKSEEFEVLDLNPQPSKACHFSDTESDESLNPLARRIDQKDLDQIPNQ